MKVTIPRSALAEHKKVISVARRSSKFIKNSSVTITASEKLSVSGMGFSATIKCTVESWGHVTLPFIIWEKIIKASLISDEYISIKAETGHIQANTFEFNHPLIHVARIDDNLSSLPLNASLKDVVNHVFNNTSSKYDELIRNRTVLEVLSKLLKHIHQANEHLQEWDIDTADIAEMITGKLQIKDKDLFLDILFSDEVRSFCR